MLITFEGPEGSGKTTQIAHLAAWLKGQGYAVDITREPGGTAIGDQIRGILMGMENHSLVPEAEGLLFSASRAQLVRQRIRPALAAGQVVLCDRFYDSTLAYQGFGHGLPLDLLRAITHFATGGLVPHRTLLLDLDPAEGLRRRRDASGQGAEWNRMDDLRLPFHQRVREGYLTLAREEPQRWRIVDASPPPPQVQQALRAHLLDLLVGAPAT